VLHYALYCLLATCDILGNVGIGLEQDILFWCFISKFKTALYTYALKL